MKKHTTQKRCTDMMMQTWRSSRKVYGESKHWVKTKENIKTNWPFLRILHI